MDVTFKADRHGLVRLIGNPNATESIAFAESCSHDAAGRHSQLSLNFGLESQLNHNLLSPSVFTLNTRVIQQSREG